jgi:hypothetical protein
MHTLFFGITVSVLAFIVSAYLVYKLLYKAPMLYKVIGYFLSIGIGCLFFLIVYLIQVSHEQGKDRVEQVLDRVVMIYPAFKIIIEADDQIKNEVREFIIITGEDKESRTLLLDETELYRAILASIVYPAVAKADDNYILLAGESLSDLLNVAQQTDPLWCGEFIQGSSPIAMPAKIVPYHKNYMKMLKDAYKNGQSVNNKILPEEQIQQLLQGAMINPSAQEQHIMDTGSMQVDSTCNLENKLIQNILNLPKENAAQVYRWALANGIF